MKKCPHCAEDIQDAAVICRYCQRNVTALPAGIVLNETPHVEQAPAAPEKKQTTPAAWGCLTILVLIVVGWMMTPSTPTPSSAPVATPPAAPAAPALALLSSRGYQTDGGGYFVVEGQVKNLSATALDNVAANSQWFDKAGGFISSSDAMIDYNPLLPGQTSPFKTMTRANPEMKSYTVEFKHLMGGAIKTDDQRKTK